MMSIAVLLGTQFVSYGFGKILDSGYNTLFKDKKDFEDRLYAVINKAIDEYKQENAENHHTGECPFYESQIFMDTLLKYRLFEDNKILEYNNLKQKLSDNQNILIPEKEDIENFINIFDKQIKNDDKFMQIFCLEKVPEEIYKISSTVKDIYEKQDEILRQSKDNGKKLNILLDKEAESNKSKKDLTNYPKQEKYVVGRDNDLEQVKAMLETDSSLLLMNGLGGIGKTTLARKYLYEFGKDYDRIVWLEVSQGVVEAFTSNLTLHKNLGIIDDIKDIKPEIAFDLIINELRNMDGCNIMVLDDAKEDFVSIKNQLPGKPNWKLLVTSRQNFAGITPYHLDFLNPEEAIKLFYEYYDIEKDDELLDKIFEPVKYHTLVVELFAKMAAMNSLALSDLVARANNAGISITTPTEVKIDHSKVNIKNILEYLKRTFSVRELPDEFIVILRKLAIMPSGFYELEYLDFFLSVEDENKEGFHLNLNKLVKLGWLEKSENDYKLHEIISQLVLNEYPPEYEYYEDYINLLYNISLIDQSKDNPVEKFFIIPFCLNVIEYIQDENDVMGYLMKNTASLLSHQGRYSEALAINIRALGLAERIGNKKLKLNIMTNIGLDYEDLGKYEEARDYMEQILSEISKVFGDNHSNIATIQSNLANVYRNLGEYAKARDLLKKALASDIENFGEKHPNVAVDQSILATVCQDLGEYTKARDLLEKALESDIENFGEKHPKVAVDQSSLAIVYKNLGEYAKARKLLEKALESDIENFGEKHPNVAVDQSSLATVYKDLGEYGKARDLLEKALESDIENFGEKHPKVAVRQSNLANVYSDLGENAKARDLLEKALESDIENFGEKHPNVAVHQSNLATVYQDLGKYGKARDLLERALASDMENFGEKHPEVATRYNNLGMLFLEMKEYDKAWDYFQKALSIAKLVWGEEHPNTNTTINSIKYLIKLITFKVLAGNGNEVSDAIHKIYGSLGTEDPERKQYFGFLEAIIREGDAQEAFKELSPEYQQLVIDVQNEMKQRVFWEKVNKYTVIAIQAHNGQENHLEEIRDLINNLREDIHPEIKKYFGFLLEYAEGKKAEEFKDVIDIPLWEWFIEIRDGLEDGSEKDDNDELV